MCTRGRCSFAHVRRRLRALTCAVVYRATAREFASSRLDSRKYNHMILESGVRSYMQKPLAGARLTKALLRERPETLLGGSFVTCHPNLASYALFKQRMSSDSPKPSCCNSHSAMDCGAAPPPMGHAPAHSSVARRANSRSSSVTEQKSNMHSHARAAQVWHTSAAAGTMAPRPVECDAHEHSL